MGLKLAIALLQAYIGSTPFKVGTKWYLLTEVPAPKS